MIAQVRRCPAMLVDGVVRTLGVTDAAPSTETEGSYTEIRDDFEAGLRAVGARTFSEATIRTLIAKAADPNLEAERRATS